MLTARMEKALDSFQSMVTKKITVMQTRQRKGGIWLYPPLVVVMKETGMVEISTSILRRQNTVAQFISTRPILDLCEQATRRPGSRVSWRWWEQTGIDWKGARKREEAAEAAEPGTKAFTDLESDADNAMEGTVGGKGEEESLGASGSSGAEWSGVEWGGG